MVNYANAKILVFRTDFATLIFDGGSLFSRSMRPSRPTASALGAGPH